MEDLINKFLTRSFCSGSGYGYDSGDGDISHIDAREFWSLWESNFMAYHDMGVFTVRTLWES